MSLWKNRKAVENEWRVLADDAPLPEGEKVVVSLKRWRGERAALAARNTPLGLVIAAGDKWDDVAADLPRFPVIVVTIPKTRMLELCMIQGPLQWGILDTPPTIRDGYLELPDRPGLGVELAGDLEARYPYIEGPYGVPIER